MTKRCFKCGETKDLSAFYTHPRMADGHLGKCKDCTKQDVQARYYKEHEARSAYERDRNRTPHRRAKRIQDLRDDRARGCPKQLARDKTRRAIVKGLLVKSPCERCGAEKSQAHHDDYSKPLEIRWLCFRCHRQVHGQTVANL